MRVSITPFNGGWKMGDSLEVELDEQSTVRDLAAIVHDMKDIDPSRMSFFLDADEASAIPPDGWDCLLCEYKVTDGSVLRLEPSNSGCWLWHEIEYYKEEVLRQMV
eukprot:CAMPEP_0113575842 /NCGR_PEP_ID=MMETSP0015_2-20120614/27930_1 /TAXON_ID=2838 /ORGANISM="Odontella" /LENGTH=105 /DNA_ID=CAMNT_0000479141 /DNA_START=62 /DNA_END=376 /DNA_ORIENTATION=- /assembly_acc=CAM_ASM_000160